MNLMKSFKKLKLGKVGLFLILLFALVCCGLASGLREPMSNVVEETAEKKQHAETDAKTTGMGISKDQIAPGDEDLYILKSQVVPPVCPACPTVNNCGKKSECPPCPPCARCPEPAFECKKVPNYNAVESDSLPRAVLSDFSTFAM